MLNSIPADFKPSIGQCCANWSIDSVEETFYKIVYHLILKHYANWFMDGFAAKLCHTYAK